MSAIVIPACAGMTEFAAEQEASRGRNSALLLIYRRQAKR